MVVCRHFQPVVIQRLYSRVVVKGFSARKFLLALTGQSSRSTQYASALHRLSYTLSDDDANLSLPLLGFALQRTWRLTTLIVSIPVEYDGLLFDILREFKFEIQPKSMFDIIQNGRGEKPLGIAAPRLQSLDPGGLVLLLEAARFRDLRAIRLSKPIGLRELQTLADSIGNGVGYRSVLDDLRICLQEGLNVVSVLRFLGRFFHSLRVFSIEQRAMKALVGTTYFLL